jgi:hypothetical protein
VLVRVTGANINFIEDGTFHSILDALSMRHLTDLLAPAQELGDPRCIGGGAITLTAAAVRVIRAVAIKGDLIPSTRPPGAGGH